MKRNMTVPILVMTVGTAWLLNVLEVVPDVDWIWSLGLAVAGLLCLTVGGITKTTVVAGPLLMVASVCSVLRQTGRLHEQHEVPILVIVLGALMLLAQFLPLEEPRKKRGTE